MAVRLQVLPARTKIQEWLGSRWVVGRKCKAQGLRQEEQQWPRRPSRSHDVSALRQKREERGYEKVEIEVKPEAVMRDP